MHIGEMHFDFKQKLNRVGSQQVESFRVPEIDRFLNEGMVIFIKRIAMSRKSKGMTVDISRRVKEDLRTIVVRREGVVINTFKMAFPQDYMFFVSGEVVMTKEGKTHNGRILLYDHDMRMEGNPYYGSSFEWREAVGTMDDSGITFHNADGVSMLAANIVYVKVPAYMHYASGFKPAGSYRLSDGKTLSGTQDCELPEHTHNEIVDIAVSIASGALSPQQYVVSKEKLALDEVT